MFFQGVRHRPTLLLKFWFPGPDLVLEKVIHLKKMLRDDLSSPYFWSQFTTSQIAPLTRSMPNLGALCSKIVSFIHSAKVGWHLPFPVNLKHKYKNILRLWREKTQNPVNKDTPEATQRWINTKLHLPRGSYQKHHYITNYRPFDRELLINHVGC